MNHFGHFYLNHLMLPLLASDGRIVVTASSVHDPESPGGAQGVPATLGTINGLKQFGKDCEMLDGDAFNADKAYKDSKVSVACRNSDLNFQERSGTGTHHDSILPAM